MKIPIQDAIEILNMEGYDIPETDEEIYIEIPEEFTIEELYEVAISLRPGVLSRLVYVSDLDDILDDFHEAP